MSGGVRGAWTDDEDGAWAVPELSADGVHCAAKDAAQIVLRSGSSGIILRATTLAVAPAACSLPPRARGKTPSVP